jgi:hypothetical protein
VPFTHLRGGRERCLRAIDVAASPGRKFWSLLATGRAGRSSSVTTAMAGRRRIGQHEQHRHAGDRRQPGCPKECVGVLSARWRRHRAYPRPVRIRRRQDRPREPRTSGERVVEFGCLSFPSRQHAARQNEMRRSSILP